MLFRSDTSKSAIFVFISTPPSIKTATGKRYYPGLSGLRAIAALTVLFTHVDRLRRLSGMKPLIDPAFNSFIGGTAVTFFFVLSGFLITLLLLNEKAAEGTIRIRSFLANRALRIWPLYYVTLVAGYVVSIFVLQETDADPVSNGFLLNLLLLPNVSFVLGRLPDILIQLWSIGTEEQFYLVWPFFVKRLSAAGLIRVFIIILLFWVVARMPIQLLRVDADWFNAFLFRTRIDCMAIGGFAALLLFYQESSTGWWSGVYRVILRPLTGWVSALGFIFLLVLSGRYHVSLYQLYALLFAIGCLRVTGLPVRWLEFAPLRYLGKISYGIYLLHHFALYFLFKVVLVHFHLPAAVIFFLAVLLTTGLAAFSYTFFESFFLKRKVRLRAPSPGPTLS